MRNENMVAQGREAQTLRKRKMANGGYSIRVGAVVGRLVVKH